MLIVSFAFFLSSKLSAELSPEARKKGFVYLHEIDPTIKVSLRYFSNENFVGKPVDSYKDNVLVLTKKTAKKLKKVQREFQKDGYCLVIYDAYRPQDAVNHFVRWSEDASDQAKKSEYYPRVDKAKVFELGYVARRSGHSRGSTVDLTLIKNDKQLHEIEKKERTLLDGFVIQILDDGTEDFGSSFDLFDKASHYENDVIPQEFLEKRKYLKEKMEKYFNNYSEEWWHFTAKDEPYTRDQEYNYFNFPIE